jgi:hypothetical protein
MINLRFQIDSPCTWDYFKNLGCLHGSFTKNKHWELEHNYYSGSLVDCEFQINRQSDHAGLTVTIGLLGYGISFRIYDHRHWDYETNNWKDYNNEL